MDINVRIAGQAGQGLQTVGDLLVGAVGARGVHVFATKSYMSRIRGGLNWYDVRLGEGELFAGRETADLLVSLSDEALTILAGDLSAEGYALHNGDAVPADCSRADNVAAINFTKVAKEVADSALHANVVAAGAVWAVLGYECGELCDYIASRFEQKHPELVDKNVRCARRGYEIAAGQGRTLAAISSSGEADPIVSGAEAIGQAVALAGVKFVTAYPMTPSTATFTYLAQVADEYGMVVEQAEDEIAAVNMVCGATYAGVPSITMTSGGGFALMVEGLSLAGIMELPIVIIIAQRPGPATGLPTRTGQQDLGFALHAGHGEFPRVLLAPGTHEQCRQLTRRALELAHKYQTPAIILTDQFLQDAQKNIPAYDDNCEPIDRHIVEAGSKYARYAATYDGVSPRAIPGGDAFVVCDSDEHDERGHISEDLRGHLTQHAKRMCKLESITAEAAAPQLYGPADAETLLLCWGSTYGPCREAIDRLSADSESVAMLHFAQLWPIATGKTAEALHGRTRLISVEGNSTAQLASLLREVGVLGECGHIARVDGLPFTADYIIDEIAKEHP